MTHAVSIFVHYIGYPQMIIDTWLLININVGAQRFERIAYAYDNFITYASIILGID